MKTDIFTGVIPALMTPCTAARQPDFDALVRKAQELIAAGMSAVVYCGSMGDWPLLTDAQRMEGVEALVRAGLPVIVGTGAVNSALAVAHAAHAQKVAPYIHPELEQKSLAVYLVKTFIWPGRRMRFDGTPVVIESEGPDREWVQPNDVVPEY